jgi:L-lactate dehydrogenase
VKVGVVGVGAVGAATAVSPTVEVRAGDYDALTDAALVIITAGVNEQAGGATDRSDPQGRRRLLDTNARCTPTSCPRPWRPPHGRS